MTSIQKALALCRGRYQRAVVQGDQLLSGADLKGAASRSGVHYRNSRAALLKRLRAEDLGEAIRGPHGRVDLLIGTSAERTAWLAEHPEWRTDPGYLVRFY